MKISLLKVLIIGFVLFSLEGCYTIIWTPDKKITEDYISINHYYGYEAEFYDIPWWINVPIIVEYPYFPGSINLPVTKERDNSRDTDLQDIRNNNGGRTSEILRPPSPTINTNNSNNSSTGSISNTGSSGNVSRTESSSGNSSSSNTSRTSDTRNDSGSRNSGKERK